jgi:hypothetical protein
MNQSSDHDAQTQLLDIRHLSAEQFSNLGVSQLAYVKPVMLNGARAFAIHGADGTIAQHEMVPSRVH